MYQADISRLILRKRKLEGKLHKFLKKKLHVKLNKETLVTS